VDSGCDTAGTAAAYFLDADGDGFGALPVRTCTPGPEHVSRGEDCDDARADVYPGAPEPDCGVDADCDGVTVDCIGFPLESSPNRIPGHTCGDVVGDLNGDGTLELLACRLSYLPDDVRLWDYYLLSGERLRGEVAPEGEALHTMRHVYYSNPVVPPGSTLANYSDRVHDLNGDGLEDLLLLEERTVLMGPLPDGFRIDTPARLDLPGADNVVGQGDLTGDGVADLLVARSLPPWSAAVQLLSGPFPDAGTVDEDTRATLQVTMRDIRAELSYCEVLGYPVFPKANPASWYESAGDTDGDGAPELLIGLVSFEGDGDGWCPRPDRYGHHYLYPLDQTGSVDAGDAELEIETYYAAGIGDTDGDGYDDLVVDGSPACPDTCVFFGPLVAGDWTANRSLRIDYTAEVHEAPVTPKELGDLDGDGRAEIAYQTASERKGGSLYTFHVLPGGYAPGVYRSADIEDGLRFTLDATEDRLAEEIFHLYDVGWTQGYGSFREPADLDGDGRDDLVFAHYLTGISVYYGADLTF
jgi:hypothetical protein